MLRLMAWAVGALMFVGCHAPTPSFDFFSPYAPPRVPPPGTGSYGKADARLGAVTPPYYEGAITTATAVGAPGSRSATGSPSGWRPAETNDKTAGAASQVALVSHSQAVDDQASASAEPGDVILIEERSAPVERLAVEFKGMPLNDATKPRQPQTSVLAPEVATLAVSSGSSVTVLPGSAPIVTPWNQPLIPGAMLATTPRPAAAPAVSVLPTSASTVAVTPTPAEPRRFNPSEHLIEITQLPAPDEPGSSPSSRLRGLASTASTAAPDGSVVVQASATAPVEESQSAPVAKTASLKGDGWRAR